MNQPVCTATGVQSPIAVAPDGAGGSLIAWQDSRNVGTTGIAALTPGGTVDTPIPAPARALSLSAPRPNPMRNEVRMTFALPAASFVTVAVFDERGRRVRDLESGLLPPGEHALRWDGRDREGRLTAPGAYFVRLETQDQSLTRTLVRVR